MGVFLIAQIKPAFFNLTPHLRRVYGKMVLTHNYTFCSLDSHCTVPSCIGIFLDYFALLVALIPYKVLLPLFFKLTLYTTFSSAVALVTIRVDSGLQ